MRGDVRTRARLFAALFLASCVATPPHPPVTLRVKAGDALRTWNSGVLEVVRVAPEGIWIRWASPGTPSSAESTLLTAGERRHIGSSEFLEVLSTRPDKGSAQVRHTELGRRGRPLREMNF